MIHFDPFVLTLINAQSKLAKHIPALLQCIETRPKEESILDSIKRHAEDSNLVVGLSEAKCGKVQIIISLSRYIGEHAAQIVLTYMFEPEWFKNRRYLKVCWSSNEWRSTVFKHDCIGLNLMQLVCSDDYRGEHFDELKKYNSYLLQNQRSVENIHMRDPSTFQRFRFSYFFCADSIEEIFVFMCVRFFIDDVYGGVVGHRADFPIYKMADIFDILKYRMKLDRSKERLTSHKKLMQTTRST